MDKRERGRAIVDWLVYNGYAENRGDLAKKLNYNPTVLSAALTGRISFSDKMAKRLCEYNQRLNYNWLMFEEGDMLLAENDTADKNKRTTTRGKKTQMVPFYRELQVSAGQADMFEYNEQSDMVYIPGVDADAFFPVVGMSMQPSIQPGDIIGVKNLKSFERIDPTRIYMIITRQNERMIKHIMPSRPEDDEITLTSDNTDYSSFTVMKEDILKVMRVVYVGRML